MFDRSSLFNKKIPLKIFSTARATNFLTDWWSPCVCVPNLPPCLSWLNVTAFMNSNGNNSNRKGNEKSIGILMKILKQKL